MMNYQESAFFNSKPLPRQEDAMRLMDEWQELSYGDIVREMSLAHVIETTETTSQAIVLDPIKPGEIDERQSIALALPHLNGFSPHQYIRARVMQELLLPNGRIVILPNGSEAYDLGNMNAKAQEQLNDGDITPFGEQQMRTLEKVNTLFNLGDVAATGYSLGGRTVVGMAAAGSEKVNIISTDANETPHKLGRDAKQLKNDFIKSGGIFDLRTSARDSNLPALNSATRANRMAVDLVKFGLASLFSKDAKLMHQAMTGSIAGVLEKASNNGTMPIKLGHIEGSLLFDADGPERLVTPNISIETYTGPEFHAHTSGDNVIWHALMASSGIRFR